MNNFKYYKLLLNEYNWLGFIFYKYLALYIKGNHGHEVEWRQDSGFGTSSLPRSYSDHDPNDGSNERTNRYILNIFILFNVL
jgi:hypothetical protein